MNGNNRLTTAVVISCYSDERLDWLREAVDSVLRQKKKADDVIVVCDEIPGLKDSLRDNLPSSVTIVPNKARRGLSQARNTGLESARSDIVVFLDDDAVASPDWLEQILKPFSDPFVMGVGGKAIPDWIGTGKRPAWFPEELDWTIGCTHTSFGEKTKPVRNVFGCNMAFRREQLLSIDGFDFRLGGPISGDDTDICLRITAGDPRFHIIYEPKAVIHHKVPRKRQTFRHISYNAWIQGIGKAVTKDIHKVDDRALASEKTYLNTLLFRFFPKQLLCMFRNPVAASGRMCAVTIAIVSIGLGYVLTRLKVHRVNLLKYKTT